MKKLILLSFSLFTCLGVSAQIKKQFKPVPLKNKINISTMQRQGNAGAQSVSGILREGFENVTFPPAGWQAVNVSGPEVWQRSNLIPHSGAESAFCLYEQGAAYGEDWLIMPKFNATVTDSLHFWLGITDPGWPDSLYVLVSTTDSALTSFTNTELILADGNGYPTVHHGFVQHHVDLSAYAGQSIYIAFRNWNANGDGVSIDDVELGTPPAGDVASISWDKPHVLGDTAQAVLATVKNTGTTTQTFNVTMTLTGGYTSTQTVTALAPNTTTQVSFDMWTPNVMGTNVVKMYTQLAGDGYMQNDTLIDTLHISHISNDDIRSVRIDMLPKTGNYAQTPMVTFRNNGFNTETFNVTMTISGGYTSTQTVTSLASFDTIQVAFASWTPTIIGSNSVKVYAQLSTDADKTNDTLKTTVQVFQAFTNYGWSSHPPMPAPYSANASAFYHTGTYPNDTSVIFSIGGGSPSPVVNDLSSFSSLTNAWANGTSAPVGKYLASAQTVNGKVYYLGGLDAAFAPSNRNDIYDIATDSWNTGADMPEPIADFASGVYKDSLIYVIGGYDAGGNASNAVRIYDTYNDTWSNGTSKTGAATYGVRCGIYKNKIVSVGGNDGSVTVPDAKLGVINPTNPTSITWSALPNYPGAQVLRHSSGSVYRDELPLVVFTAGDTATSGNFGMFYTDETWAYDLSSNSWKIGPRKITGTNNNCNLLGAVFNDTLYMVSVGGNDGTNPLDVNEWLNMGPDTSVHTMHIRALSLKDGIFAYPNPFIEKTTVAIHLNTSEKVSVNIFDIHGRLVAELCNKQLNEGDHTFTWNAHTATSGIYVAQVVAGNSVTTKKLIKN